MILTYYGNTGSPINQPSYEFLKEALQAGMIIQKHRIHQTETCYNTGDVVKEYYLVHYSLIHTNKNTKQLFDSYPYLSSKKTKRFIKSYCKLAAIVAGHNEYQRNTIYKLTNK